MDKSYRIHTNIAEDTLLQVNMEQDFDFLEVLSLKLRQKDAYRLHSSNYGVIIGRVLANDAFGIPNAKLSIFIERDENDPSDMEFIYPYKEVTTKDKEGRRYNILPDYSDDDCYRVVGTFPNKRLMLDDDTHLDVYDKYWKYTTVTNNAGDYMIFGVPTGSVTVHVDIDLSDIGVLSQRPRDFEYKGYNLSMFDSPNQFKESTNLDNLAQLFSQNRSVFVYPFWGDADNGVASITRADIQIQYKFEPTCVFMGSIVSDNEGHAIGHKCAPDIENGMNNQLVAGNGTIEMIRKTTDGLVEEYQIQGNQLIDENGVWCYQIPMNLDYIGTDEYGNIVPTDNPNKGIPTRTQVRFRFSKNETNDEGFSRHTAKYLVPMNPIFSEEQTNVVNMDEGNGGRGVRLPGEIPVITDRGVDIEKMYTFGSATPLHCFRDLYWNNVYSVKNYIPKTQVAHRAYSKNYGALKGSNLAEDQNPIPFNKLRIDLPFLYMIVCLIFTMIVYIVWFINSFIICTIDTIIGILNTLHNLKIPVIKVRPFRWIPAIPYIGCIVLSAGISEGNVAYYPGCWCNSGLDASDCPAEMEGNCEKSRSTQDLLDKIQRNLAQEFKIIKLDLYQDWINGCLYMPLWYWRKRKKKTFLFLTLSRAKNEYCSDKSLYSRLKTYVTCNIKYTSKDFDVSNNRDSMPDSEERWHKNRAVQVRYKRGLIKPVENKDGLTAYYYAALQATSDNANDEIEMIRRDRNFKAVRLFATDIILLGNLDPKNIYGIPQFFTCLPSTTANIPAVATIEETLDPNEKGEVYDKDISGNAEDSGTTVTTGMDWNHDGDEKTPAYSTGLFIDLACTYARTRPKSCINVERLSELGVSLDMTHNMAYHEGGDSTQYGQIDADGFISKYELDDMENRAMFATMNHIGFIPQEYQDMHDAYTTQVPDRNTNYLIPKFKYMYPVDFDGRLQLPMDLYNNGFEQALYDEKDETYITFRMGAEYDRNNVKENNSEGRIRHFYHNYDNGRLYDMPLYNNSFYFYFGIKKGSTAIDKFNEMFYAPCFKSDKKPFTLDLETQGRSYCPDIYEESACNCPSTSSVTPSTLSGSCRYVYGSKKNHAYGYIKVSSDDIRTPYSYKLYDQFNEIVIEEEGVTEETFVIGGQIDSSGNTLSNCNGWIFKQVPNDYDMYERIEEDLEPYYLSGLTNQEYTLEVRDSDGRTITEKVKLDVPKIAGVYRSTPLGTKFYNSATTRIDYICHDDNMFYGKIEMTHFSVDGYKCQIVDVEYEGYRNDYVDDKGVTRNDDTRGRYVFCVTGSSEDISSNVVAYVEIYVYKSTRENLVRNCLCDNNLELNLVAAAQNQDQPIEMKIDKANRGDFFAGIYDDPQTSGKTIGWFVYQPNKYIVKITQGCTDCDNLVKDNFSEDIINVMNGTPFITTLNEMPTKFMLGTASDTNDASIANTSYFYRSKWPVDETDYNIKGWYGIHEEDSYMFSRRNENKTYNYNQLMWEDFYTGTKDDVAAPKTKRTILKFKFDKMFSLAEGAYITTDSSCRFKFDSKGGIPPILHRMVTPIYSNLEKAQKRYLLKDGFNIQSQSYIPNIVADNYSLPFERNWHYTYDGFVPDKPHYNSGFYTDNSNLIGNYFAAFTRDGSYITKKTIDGINIKIERSPSFASISPISNTNTPKPKGKDIEGTIDKFKYVYEAGTQHLDGDETRYVQPYLRALYVDRRFDFDFVVMSPAINKNFSLYTNKDRNLAWKGGRISGWTYNGIEMSYDEDYNIISAHTYSADSRYYQETGEDVEGTPDVEYTAATFNKRLEYTYKYDCAHKCLTCGYDFTENRATCPKCGHNNIKYFHGEIGTPVVVRKKGNIDYYEMGEHTKDTVNFNPSATAIPGIVKSPPNEPDYTLDDAVTYYHKWKGDWECDWKSDRAVSDPSCPKWGKWNVNYNSDGDPFGFFDGIDKEDETNPLIKQYYESMINEIELRHLYWSLFNYKRLEYYTNSDDTNQQRGKYGPDAINNPKNPLYVYHYPYYYNKVDTAEGDDWYNGDFNRDDVVKNLDPTKGRVSQYPYKVPYPTKRYIDVCNLPQTTFYGYETASCSYGMKSMITDDGVIRAETKSGEGIDIDFDWSNPITIIPPNDSSEEYANITYLPRKGYCGYEPFTDCVSFSASTGAIAFRINPYTCADFEVYTKAPRLIQVLPYIDFSCMGGTYRDIDGIGYLKTCNPDIEFGKGGPKLYGDNKGRSLDDAIDDVTLNGGEFKQAYNNYFTGRLKDVYLPEGVEIDDGYKTKYGLDVSGYFFKKDDDWLVSDDDDFNNIIFKKNFVDLKNSSTCGINGNCGYPGGPNPATARVFTVLIDREYRYEDDDNLVRRIRTLQTSDLFDCRPLYMKITLEGEVSDEEIPDSEGRSPGDEGYVPTYKTGPLTYVEMRKGGVSGISGVNESSTSYGDKEIEVDVEDSEGGQSSGNISVPTTTNNDTKLGEDTTKIYIQTLTFDMKFDTSDGTPIPCRQNEAFADYDMMSYVFRFKNRYGEQFDIVPSKVFMISKGSYAVLRFILKWPVNMGIIADPQWTGIGMGENVPVEVFARTTSNFIYKLTDIMMKFCCGQDVNGTCKMSDNVEEDIKSPMDPSPDQSGNQVAHLTHVMIDPRGNCPCQ